MGRSAKSLQILKNVRARPPTQLYLPSQIQPQFKILKDIRMSGPGSYCYSAGSWIQPHQLWKITRLEVILNNEVYFWFFFFRWVSSKRISDTGYLRAAQLVPNPASSARRGVALILSPSNKLGDFWGLRLKYCTIKGTMSISHFHHLHYSWFWIEHWISAEKSCLFLKNVWEENLDRNLRNQKRRVAI